MGMPTALHPISDLERFPQNVASETVSMFDLIDNGPVSSFEQIQGKSSTTASLIVPAGNVSRSSTLQNPNFWDKINCDGCFGFRADG